MTGKLSCAQQGVYLECVADPKSTQYNLPFLGYFRDAMEPERLKAALLKALSAHPALRAVLCEDADGQIFLKTEETPMDIPVYVMSEEDFARRKDSLVRPFDLNGGRLARFEIYQTPEHLYLFEDIHHLICDGTSYSVLAADVRRALDGMEPEQEQVSVFELAAQEERWLTSDEAAADRDYWRTLLQGCEESSEPEPDQWEETRSQGWLFRNFAVDEAALSAVCRRAGCSKSAFFTAAFACLASVFTGQEDLLFNTIYSGRDELSANTVGMLVRTFPFRADLREQGLVDDFLRAIHDEQLQSRDHSRYPYLKLSEEFGLRPELQFGYQGRLSEDPMVAGCDIAVERLYDPAHIESGSVLFEVMTPAPGQYTVHLGYRTDRFSNAWAGSFVDTYLTIVRELLKKSSLRELALVSGETLRLFDGFNATETPRDGTDLVAQFRRCAAQTPDQTAVVAEGRRYSYAETDRITDALAAYLRARGIGHGSVVSVLIPRNEFMPFASFGILKTGAAYQPLDPSYPESRLRFMVEDAGAVLLIADRTLAGKLGDWSGSVLYTDEIAGLPEAEAFDADIRPEDLFVLLYTSGTTGTPKGAMLTHGNVAEMIAWARSYYRMDSSSRYGAYASYGFDAHMVELYSALTCGGTLCIIPDAIRLDLGAICEFFDENQVTVSQMTTQVGRQFAMAYPGGSLRDLMVGGEALVPVDPEKISFRLHNAYGPSECTLLATIQPVDRLYHRIPIGKPLENVKLYVVDRCLRRLPLFAPGELLIAGPHVAKGYLHLPEKTAASFIPNPFTEEAGYDRVYRTGDVVRMLADGRLDFIGRSDGQVKIRGFRIELSEVEGVIREFPGIRDATVQAFADERTGMKYLAAYVVSDSRVDTAALAAFIRERKPPYMVPAVTMQLDAIPLTQNQKVNKRALPMPQREDAGHEPPATEEERLAWDCVAEALSHRDFGVTTDLEEAGLSSIGAMQLNVLLSKAFRRTVRIRDMKALHTVREIAAFFASAAKEHSYKRQESYPLSSVQQGVYVECLANPGSTAYNIPLLLKLDPAVDIDRLKAALTAAIDAHPYLKMRLFASGNGEIRARRDDDAMIDIEVTEKTALHMGFSGLVRPFRLTEEALVRVVLIRDGAALYLFFDAHHLVFDGESLVVFLRDLETAYRGGTPGKEAYTGFEFALDEQQLRLSSSYAEAKAYYAAMLEGLDTDCLPVRDRNDSIPAPGLESLHVVLDREETQRILRGAKTTPNALWNAAFGLTLCRFLGRNDCVYTTVYNGRSDSRLADSVGMYVHTLPAVCSIGTDEAGMSFVSRIGRQLTDSMANDIFSFAEISRNFDVKASILFVYEGEIAASFTVGGKPAEQVALQSEALKAALTFFVHDTKDGYRIDCEYEAEHYEQWDIRSMLEGMECAVRALLNNAHTWEIPLLTDEDREALRAFNRTEKILEDTDIPALFRRCAERYPGRTAVIFGDRRLSYRELDALSDKIAVYVRSLGIGPENVVSILIPRSEYMAVAALGAMKAGAAYQPLDPGYPTERLSFMIHDAGAKLLIADESLTGLVPDYEGPVLLLKDIPGLPEGTAPVSGLRPDNLFILLYTSGTTGVPKGVMLTHRNLVNFCDWYRTNYELTQESVVAAYASFGFDADMMDLYPALTTGAAVCIVPEELRLDLLRLNGYYKAHGVTHVFMTTQMGRMFASQITDTGIRHLSVGGEKLVPIEPPEGYTLTNGYGPTECTIFSTTQPVDRLYDRIPIGLPLSNYKLYVVDRQGHELPVGAMGELWIAGYGVGRGYLNQPERSAEVFTANPFCTEPGFDRVFRTGDVVRRLADGRIDFIGRNDGQVKVRGFRIELAEVEGVIREFPGIRDVTVQAFEDEVRGGKYIAAYVVSGDAVDFGRLSLFIREKKPAYMVPAAWKQLDAIPLNQNQKVNRRALPLPERRDESQDYVAPATPLEKEICDEFCSILGLERVSVTDSFFDIGGSSISAAEIVMFAMEKGYPVVYKDVFNNPSARELARAIAGMGKEGKAGAAADFDYTDINRLIALNSMEHVDEISAVTPDSIILTGPTGFLGIHVLKAFLEKTDGSVTCLMRRGRYETVEKRLKEMLMYYFGETMTELFGNRIFCVEGDITEPESLAALDGSDAGMVINCAACVKHFVKDDTLDRVNYHGVENLIDLCLRNSMRLVQVSTLSVSGEIELEHLTTLKENMLFFGQNVRNDYVRTKFLAERAILDAKVRRGLDAVILRAGNLMGRLSDGEFQINFETNAFIRSLWAYIQLRECPYSVLEQPVEFSPIDSVAGAVIALAGADSRFSIFHIKNNHTITMGDVMDAMRRHGFDVTNVSDTKFQERLSEAARHPEESRTVLSLVAYANREGEQLAMVDADHRFTVNALFRLGYRWPIISDSYLERIIWALDSLSFFTELD